MRMIAAAIRLQSVRVALVCSMVASLVIVGPSAAQAQAAPPVVISEFLAANAAVLADNTGAYPDWIELRNTSGSAVSLAGWTLSAGPDVHTFVGPTIAAGDYLVVFASGDSARTIAGELHLDFKLGSGGESLVLADAGGVVSSPAWPAAYPQQRTDISYGVDGNGGTFFFDPPTPGAANGVGGVVGFVEPVTFSVDHGWFDAAQAVVLTTSTPSATIRYTVDGSTPTASNGTALAPGQSVSIAQTTTLRAVAVRPGWVASPVQTRSYLFAADIALQPETTPTGWPDDVAPPTNQRMIYGMNPDLVTGNEAAIEASLMAVPTISVTTDLDNLFDPDTGIYVNARNKGKAWEREVSMELFDPAGNEAGFAVNAGLRIRGASTRSPVYAKHNWGFFFRDEYGGDLAYPLFGDDGVDVFEKIDLRTAMGTDWARFASEDMTMLRELWYRDAQRDMGQPYTRSRYYNLFINGQYWGLYLTQERVGDSFGESYFGGNESEYDAMKHDYNAHPITGEWPSKRYLATDGNGIAWESLHPLVIDQVVTDAEYAVIADQVDLVSLADYYLLHMLGGSWDGAPDPGTGGRSNNWFSLRNRTGVGEAGKWLFFHHDQAGALCVRDTADYDSTTPWDLTSGGYLTPDYMAPPWLHQSLLTQPAYAQIFKDRVQKHVLDPGGALTVAASIARIDERAVEMEGAMSAHAARWGDAYGGVTTRTLADWQNAIEGMRDCVTTRIPLVEDQLREDGLWPLSDPPVISPDGGVVAGGTLVSVVADPLVDVWVTTDGLDPLGANGQPAPSAVLYTGPFAIAGSTVVKARTLAGGEWSPIATVEYVVPEPARMILNEWNAVDSDKFLKNGGTDSALGTVLGNGGDWFELVVIEDDLDVRGWTLEISDADNVAGVQEVTDTFEFAVEDVLSSLRAGTIITVSEDFADDVSYNPAGGDWTLNLQANSDDAGGFFTAASQSNFGVNNQDWQLTIRDAAGDVVFGPAGEGIGASGVGSDEIGELEADPSSAIVPTVGYDDGDDSTFGEPNGFDGRLQNFDLIRPDVDDNVEPDATIATPAVGDVLTNPNVTISGIATDNAGVDSVRVAIKDRDSGLWLQADGTYAPGSDYLYATLDTPGATSTSWTLDVTLAEGRWFAVVRAEDTSTNRDSTKPNTRFDIETPAGDAENPDGAIDIPVLRAVLDGPTVTMSGTATDDVGVERVRVTIKNRATGQFLQADGSFSASFARIPTTLSNPDGPATDWTFTSNLPDGDYALTLDVRDTSNKPDPTRARISRFTVVAAGADTTAPDTAVTNPAPGDNILGGVFTATGTATDNIGVTRVRVSIQNVNTKLWLQPNGTMGTFTLLEATLNNPAAASTTWTLDLSAPTGDYALTARAVDAAGNTDPTRPRVRFQTS